MYNIAYMNTHRHDAIVKPPQYEAVISAEAQVIAAATQVPHEALTSLLEDPESERIALYIPEAWLPTDATPNYREAYLDAWWHLLAQRDQRADFVDGDIGEMTDMSAPELVVKAAHLAPMLGRAGLVTAADIERITYGTDSALLRQSFADTATSPQRHVPSTLFDYHDRFDRIVHAATDETLTPARAEWLYESQTAALVRDAARGMGLHHAEWLTTHTDTLDTRIAIAALARYGRAGADISRRYPWLTHQLEHDDTLVRRQATSAFRQLHYSGTLSAEEVANHDVTLPTLSGNISENLTYINKEIDQAERVARQIKQNEHLHSLFYPAVLLGGSKLKGYGDGDSDTDWALVARPDARVTPELLAQLDASEAPVVIMTAERDDGLAVDAVYANMVYGAAWIGDEQTIAQLQQDVAVNLTSPHYRRFALRRLEQDSLQYRLLHKGYERHHAVLADDTVIFTDGIDSQSTFWDPGYRRLATQIFAERVTLPKK